MVQSYALQHGPSPQCARGDRYSCIKYITSSPFSCWSVSCPDDGCMQLWICNSKVFCMLDICVPSALEKKKKTNSPASSLAAWWSIGIISSWLAQAEALDQPATGTWILNYFRAEVKHRFCLFSYSRENSCSKDCYYFSPVDKSSNLWYSADFFFF